MAPFIVGESRIMLRLGELVAEVRMKCVLGGTCHRRCQNPARPSRPSLFFHFVETRSEDVGVEDCFLGVSTLGL